MGSKIVKKYGYKFVVDGQEKEVDESRFNDYGGIESYKEDFPNASVRMTSVSGKQANIPLSKYDDAVKAGFSLSKWEKNDTINEPSENDFAEYFIDDSLTQEQKNINNADTTDAPAMTMDQIEQAVGEADGGDSGYSDNSTNSAATHTPLRVEDKDVNLQSVRDIVERNKAVNDIYSDVNKKMLEYGKGNLLGDKKAVKTGIEWNDETKTFDDKYTAINGTETWKDRAEVITWNEKPNIGFANAYADSEAEIDRRIAEVNKRSEEYTKRTQEEKKKKESEKSLWERTVDAFKGAHDMGASAASSVITDNMNDPEFKNLLVQSIMLDQAKRRMQASKREKADGVLTAQNAKNVATGVSDALLDPETLGGSTLTPIVGVELARVSKKVENGESLTEDEKDLVIVASLLQEAQGKDVPLGYTAGDMFGRMLPFVAEIALNPAKGVATSVAKSVAKNTVRKFGRQSVKSAIAKGVGRTIGDVAQASTLAGTLQAPKVVGEAGKRMAGEASIELDSHGNVRSVDFKDREGVGEALGKSFATMAIENYTELLGEQVGVLAKGIAKGATKAGKYVAKKADEGLDVVARATTNEKGYKMLQDAARSGMNVASKVGKKAKEATQLLRLDKISDFINSKGVEQWANATKKLEDNIKLSGLGGELFEEEAAIVLNALIVGDEKFENLTDAEHQMQLLCGVGLMNGTMGVVRTASFANGYRKAKKAYDKANLDAERMIGKAEWDALRNKIDLADNDELVQTLVGVAQGNNYTSPQKQAIETYAYELQRYRGYNLAGENKRKEDAYNSLYEQGYDAEGADRKVVVAEYAKAKAKADKPFAGDADKILSTYKGKKPSEIEAEIKAEKSIKPEDKAMLIDYVRAKYRYDAMMQRMDDDIENELQEVNETIDAVTNKNTGTIMQVKIKGSDGLCYVVGGKLAQDVTTGEVLADVSSDMIVVLDANTGKRKAVNKLDIEQVVLNENAEKYKQTRMNEVRANNNARNEAQLKEWEAEALASAEETEAPKANDNETAPVVEAPVAERGGKAVDVEDVIAVYNFSKSDAVAARKQPEAYADIITDLEVDRQNAIAWSEGRQGAEQPDNCEYWKEREGINEPVISDTRTEEQKAVEAEEQKNTIALGEQKATEAAPVDVQDYVAKWNDNTGEKVQVANSVEEVANTEARAAIEQGVKVKGWYDTRTGEVVVYAPNVKSAEDLVLTIVHENVSHKGLRDTLGKDIYNKMCDKTWEMMDEATRAKYESYAGVNSIKDETERHRNGEYRRR